MHVSGDDVKLNSRCLLVTGEAALVPEALTLESAGHASRYTDDKLRSLTTHLTEQPSSHLTHVATASITEARRLLVAYYTSQAVKMAAANNQTYYELYRNSSYVAESRARASIR